MKRLQYVDISKGIGIILVVWGHSLIGFGQYIIYMFYMPLFFYLSGIFHRRDRFKFLVSRKFRSLILPLLIFIIALSPLALLNHDTFLSIKPPHLRGIFGPLWFLLSLFLLSLLYHPIQKLRPTIRLLVCMLLGLLLGFIPSVFKLENYAYCFTTFTALTFYAEGNVIGDRFVKVKNRYYLAICLSLLICTLVVAYLLCFKCLHFGITDMFNNILPPSFILFILSASIGIEMILFLAKLISGHNYLARILAFIGECSIYIFAFHMAILTIAHMYIPFQGAIVEIFLIFFSLVFGCCIRPLLKKLSPTIFK